MYIAETEIFKGAKETELKAWKQYKVYKEVNRDTVDQKVLGTTWVCNLKNDRAKSRLTVRGFMEEKKLDVQHLQPAIKRPLGPS